MLYATARGAGPHHCFHDWRDSLLDAGKRILPGLLVVVLLAPFVSAYTSFKVMIPLIQPYSWDPALAAWDRACTAVSSPG